MVTFRTEIEMVPRERYLSEPPTELLFTEHQPSPERIDESLTQIVE